MSSLINKARDKVEAVLDRNSNQRNDPHSTNTANRVNPTADSDLDHRNNPHSRVGELGHNQTSQQYGSGHTAGTFASSDNYGSSTNAPGYDDPRSGNAGPHSSNVVNKLDPRVGSDRDHRNDPTSRVGGVGNTQQQPYDNYGNTGSVGGLGATESGYGNTSAAYNPTRTTAEPHRSNFANKLDPRRETGYDARNDLGSTTSGYSNLQTGPSATSAHGTTTTGYDNTYDNSRSTNAGPHSSNLMNKLDPRHDSDRDHRNDPTSRVGGYGNTRTDDYGHTAGIGSYDNTRTSEFDRSTGVGHTQPTSGTHTGFGNQPGQSGVGYGESNYTPGSGTAEKTAGPHNSNILNKLDPRVDSDMDGSKTYGGNQTHY